MSNQKSTLGEFIIENQSSFPYSSGELSSLLNALRLASKFVNHQVNKVGLVDVFGNSGNVNERAPFYCGSSSMVKKSLDFIEK